MAAMARWELDDRSDGGRRASLSGVAMAAPAALRPQRGRPWPRVRTPLVRGDILEGSRHPRRRLRSQCAPAQHRLEPAARRPARVDDRCHRSHLVRSRGRRARDRSGSVVAASAPAAQSVELPRRAARGSGGQSRRVAAPRRVRRGMDVWHGDHARQRGASGPDVAHDLAAIPGAVVLLRGDLLLSARASRCGSGAAQARRGAGGVRAAHDGSTPAQVAGADRAALPVQHPRAREAPLSDRCALRPDDAGESDALPVAGAAADARATVHGASARSLSRPPIWTSRRYGWARDCSSSSRWTPTWRTRSCRP